MHNNGGRVVWSSCNVNCGCRCPLRVHVKDGRVVRISGLTPDDVPPDFPAIRACLRGRSMRRWISAPERLQYPMKRVGKRGEGRFERISWDAALDTVAHELKRIIDTYGNEAVFRHYATGILGGCLSRRETFHRLVNLMGGSLDYYGTYSTAQISAALPYTYGKQAGNPLSDMVNSRLALFFGSNPMETGMGGGGPARLILDAKQRGNTRVVIVDPLYSDTVATVADQWIPIRPGTDAAMAAGMAHVLISEDLVDHAFLNRCCVGYDDATMPADIPSGNSYKDYILGTGVDGVAKTPGWAEAICGVSQEIMVSLAREIAATKPAYISQGWGPQRHAGGEQAARSICMLPILTGNVGVSGGNTGDREGTYHAHLPLFPTGDNPVRTSIPIFLWTQAIDDPTVMTAKTHGVRGKDRLTTPIKFIWNYAGNTLVNQHSDINATSRILADESKCEMIVVIDTFMTPSAAFADIVLPACSSLEEEDIVPPGSHMESGYIIVTEKAVEPMYECRSGYDIVAGLAKRLGLEREFTEGRTRRQWLEHMYGQWRQRIPQLPETYAQAREKGICTWQVDLAPAFENFRKDPENAPLSTPSGKIEIFSRRLWDMGRSWILPEGDMITALPEYHDTWEGALDPMRDRFPLQLIGHHAKQRTHSSYDNVDWLRDVAPQQLWMHPDDAAERGISSGDKVRVFNDRGETMIAVNVTPRIMRGVVTLPQGAWFTPDKHGRDSNGAINILTSHRPSPLAKGNPQHTNLVQVQRAEEVEK